MNYRVDLQKYAEDDDEKSKNNSRTRPKLETILGNWKKSPKIVPKQANNPPWRIYIRSKSTYCGLHGKGITLHKENQDLCEQQNQCAYDK